MSATMMHLFQQYPRLQEKLPYVSLGRFPTPVHRLHALEKCLGSREALFIKRDDQSGPYGGNKTRKLEFILGDALRRGIKTFITAGYAGSHHAVGCAYYAKQLGLHCVATLMLQPNARDIQTNLLLGHSFGAQLHHYRNYSSEVIGTAYHFVRHGLTSGRFPMYIPAGGSSLLGDVGYVNAGLELKANVDAGALPEPRCVYVAAGSLGTAVGLIRGSRLLASVRA